MSAWADDANTGQACTHLRLVADEWPPFSGEGLPGRGLSPDVISAVLRRAGYCVEARIRPWPRAVAGVRSGQYDILGSVFHDPEIAGFATYSDAYYTTAVQFVRHRGSGAAIARYDDLHRHSIAVGDGFIYEARFDAAKDLDKRIVATTRDGLLMVAHRRADLTLDSREVLDHARARLPADVTGRLEILPYVLARHGIHMAVRSDLPNARRILDDFNRVLRDMREDGSLDTLLHRHRPR